MLSNHNHINSVITIDNYEEYFILYVDDELSTDQKKLVEAFLEVHPGLTSELNLLMSTKLQMEDVRMENKEELTSQAMKVGTLSENLLLYIDKELSASEAKVLEAQMEMDNDLKLQYEILLKTRLSASEEVPYPDKRELYRASGKRVLFAGWLRIAAAIIIIAFLGLVYLSRNTRNNSGQTAVAINNKKVPEIKIHSKNIPAEHVPEIAVVRSGQRENIQITEKHSKTANSRLTAFSGKNETALTQLKQTDTGNPDGTNASAVNHVLAREPIASLGFPVKTNTELPVTSTLPARITDEHATPVESEPARASIADNSRKGSLKSFLRKATRVIEKKTGIDPTTNDDELLIGAVAVKLK